MDARSLLTSNIRNCNRATDLDLQGTDLTYMDLSRLSADRLNLTCANLYAAKFQAARLGDCRLAGAMAENSNWSTATLRLCVLDGAQVVGACFDGARIEDCSVKGANLTRASLRRAKLTETSFERSVLRNAVLDEAEGDGVQFRGADLSGATLIGARLDEADFRGADLSGANLSQGRFRSADFRGAILDGTCFDGADCTGSHFDVGAGPYADRATKTDRKSVTSSFDQMATAALHEGLTALPEMFVTRSDSILELLKHVQQVVDALGATADHPSEKWEPWLQSLIHMTKGGKTVDQKALLAFLQEAPTDLQNVFAIHSKSTADDLLGNLQRVFATLDRGADHPPDELKLWLEPLMKVIKHENTLDLKALFDMLSLPPKNSPSKGG